MSHPISMELQHQITQFLYHEAALLDDWAFRAWLELLDDDLSYTMRTMVNAQTRDRRKGVQPPTTWIFNDTKSQLERRIARLETGMAWAEEPPSRTRHMVSNCIISETAQADVFSVRVNYLLYGRKKSATKPSTLAPVPTCCAAVQPKRAGGCAGVKLFSTRWLLPPTT